MEAMPSNTPGAPDLGFQLPILGFLGWANISAEVGRWGAGTRQEGSHYDLEGQELQIFVLLSIAFVGFGRVCFGGGGGGGCVSSAHSLPINPEASKPQSGPCIMPSALI